MHCYHSCFYYCEFTFNCNFSFLNHCCKFALNCNFNLVMRIWTFYGIWALWMFYYYYYYSFPSPPARALHSFPLSPSSRLSPVLALLACAVLSTKDPVVVEKMSWKGLRWEQRSLGSVLSRTSYGSWYYIIILVMRAIAFYYVITHYFIILGISSWKALTVKLRKPWTPVKFQECWLCTGQSQ